MTDPICVRTVINVQCNQLRNEANRLERENRKLAASLVREQADYHRKAYEAVVELIATGTKFLQSPSLTYNETRARFYSALVACGAKL